LRWRVPRAGGARQDALPHAWRRERVRRAKGKTDARKHGMFARVAIEERRRIQELLGDARIVVAGYLLEEMK
jgi:hypothetical protein